MQTVDMPSAAAVTESAGRPNTKLYSGNWTAICSQKRTRVSAEKQLAFDSGRGNWMCRHWRGDWLVAMGQSTAKAEVEEGVLRGMRKYYGKAF
jgi:hypothetical protein